MNSQVGLVRGTQSKRQRWPATVQDVLVFEAIVGQWGAGASGGLKVSEESVEPSPAENPRPWPADLAQASERVREVFETAIASAVGKPDMSQWLRRMTGKAFRRLDKAQNRLKKARNKANARRVEARVIHPPASRPYDYKDAA